MKLKLLILALFPIMLFGQANLTYVRSADSSFSILNQNTPKDTLWKFTAAGYLLKYALNTPIDTIALKSEIGQSNPDSLIVNTTDTIILIGDTLYANGENGSTKTVIKAAGISFGGVVLDTVYDISNTNIHKIILDTIILQGDTILSIDTVPYALGTSISGVTNLQDTLNDIYDSLLIKMNLDNNTFTDITVTNAGDIDTVNTSLILFTNSFGGIYIGREGAAPNPSVGYNTIGIGYGALENSPGGEYNVALGYDALKNNNFGAQNTAISYYSLRSNTTGDQNTAVGSSTLINNTTGSDNTAIGTTSMNTSITGDNNTALGMSSLGNLSSGSNNIAIGYSAGVYPDLSNRLYINSIDRANVLGDSAKSIIYGQQAESTANQHLYLNANVHVPEELTAEKITVDSITTEAISIGGSTYMETVYSSKDVIEGTEIGFIQFIDTNITSHVEGRLFYDSATKGLVLDDDLSGKWNIGAELGDRFYNPTGAQINDGDVVRITGNHVTSARIYTSIELAGIASWDSTQVLGMATTNIPALGYGRVTFAGRINLIPTLGLTGEVFLGHAGNVIDTSPAPPYVSVSLGYCPYAHATDGYIEFNSREPKYSPKPTFTAFFEDSTEVITNPGLDTYELITSATNSLFGGKDNIGFIFQGDSVSPLQDGNYTIFLSYSFQGTVSQIDVYRIGIFIDGVKGYSTSRTASGTNNGGVPFPYTVNLTAGQWISFRVANTTDGLRNCEFTDGTITINYSD